MRYYLGIDLGGTNIALGVVDEEYRLMKKASTPTPKGADGVVLADAMAKAARALVADMGLTLEQMEWIGVGAPGHVDPETGAVIYACNLDLHNCPMGGLLEERTGRPVYLGNDANAAAYGEALAGAAKGTSSSVTITLGTGVGTGIVFNPKIHTGHHYCAGEGGHMVIVAGGRPCNCGRRGCLEAYASATGLIRSTREAMEAHPESRLWELAGGSLENVNGRTAWDAKDLGDPAAAKVVEDYIGYLACGVTNIVNLLAPEMVCIGGGISAQGEALLAPLRERVAREQYDQSEQSTVVVAATLGNDAGIIGAALLGKQYQAE